MVPEEPSARSGSDRTGDPQPNVRFAQTGVFHKEGEFWTIGYGGKTLRLKDTKGLSYIAHLLRHPAIEFHVLDLVGGIANQRDEDETSRSAPGMPRGEEDLEKAGIHIGTLGDAGEMLDDEAKAAYRRRISELREQLEELKELGNVERAEQAEDEIDALTKELARAVGLGGRNRRAASASERARQSVTKTIKGVLERIAETNAALGDIFSRCIRTGTFCSYQPDPEFPIAWEFATPVEPAEQPTSNRDPAEVHAVHPLAPRVLDVSPFSFAERTTFVGRENERNAIRAIIDHALDGHGSLVMLAGGPGVGKTRLAMEMSDYASSVGFRCYVGHCYERDEPFPYLPFVEMFESGLAHTANQGQYRKWLGDNAAELAQLAPSLRRVFPDIPPPLELPPEQRRRYLFQSVSEQVASAARIRPHFAVIDDLHWADEATLALSIHVLNRVAHLPVVVIGTYREEYTHNNPAFIRTLEELIRLGIRPMKLGGLSKDAIAEMLLGLSQRQAPESLVNAVFEESQGNPFFVEELYRHLVEEGKVFDAAGQFLAEIKIDEIDVPENVRLILGRRLERFDASEKQALTAAAVIGRSFSFQLLTQISQIDIDELFSVVEKAQQMGIVVPSSEGPERPFTFAHELVRQTLLTGISTPRRQRLHADVGYAIEQLYPAAVNERAAEIAHHLVRAGSAGDRQKALRYLTLAGEDALRATAYDTALNHFTSALSKLDQNDSRQRAELLYSTAIAERGVGRWDDANRHWDEALDIFIALDHREAIGKVSFRIAQSLIWSARYKEAAQVAARGLAKLEGVTSPDRASLFAALGLSQGIEGDFVKAQEAFNSALTMAESLSDNSLKGSVLAHRLNFHVYYFKLREALQESRDIAELIGTERSPWAQVQRLFWTQCALFHLGRMTEAYKIREELEPLAKKIGHFAVLLHSARMARWTEFGKQPDLIQLKADLQRDLATNQAARPFAVALSHLQLSVAEYIRGDWEKARENADTAYQSESVSMWQAISVGALFRQMAYMGDRDGALALLGRHSDKLARAKEPNSLGSWALLLLAIEGLSILGEREQAAALYRSVCELIATEAVYIVFVTRFPQTIAGIAAAAGREWEAAEEHFQIAARQAEELPNWVELAEVRRFHGAMLLERNGPGDHAKGRDLLNAALQDYVRFGMTRHAEIAKSLLQ